ncbi:MAG: hypothetical protein ACYDDA_03815 [Acidiferrobacteraceae bacterium]
MATETMGTMQRDAHYGNALLVVGGIVAAYWIWTKISGGIGAAASALTQPLANAYVGLTSGPAPIPQGSVVFPDGSYVPVSQLSLSWQGNALTTVYNGQNWQLQPHDANGNYPAIPYTPF